MQCHYYAHLLLNSIVNILKDWIRKFVRDTAYLQLIRRVNEASINDLGNQIRLEKGANIEIVKGKALRI